MLLSSVLLFALCVVLSAFFNSAETAFIGSNPYTLDYLAGKGSKGAGRVKRILSSLDDFLATILIGNTLATAAAASLATSIISSLVGSEGSVVLLATAATTLILLLFAEINPKVYAAHNPLKLSFLAAPIVRGLMVLFYPMVKAFSLLSGLLFRKEGRPSPGMARMLTEDETRVLLTSGIKGMPAFRKKMIAEIFDLASRPVKEIMVPRPEIKAVEATASREQVLETVLAERFSRFPVYRGRLDHIEGFIHTKDLIPYLVDGRPFDLAAVVRKPYFVPESAPVEKVLLQMQDRAIHMAFVIDEFGNMEGLVTFEDILEEIVGDILDESDDKAEAWHSRTEDGAVVVKGSAAVKDVNEELAFGLPESADYTTLAGFFLYEFGRIPAEKDVLVFRGRRFVVEKMSKRHIGLIRVEPGKA